VEKSPGSLSLCGRILNEPQAADGFHYPLEKVGGLNDIGDRPEAQGAPKFLGQSFALAPNLFQLVLIGNRNHL